MNNSSQQLPRVYVKKRKALPFFSRHPWVFEGAIERVQGKPEPGREVLLVTTEGQGIARGLYNPHSNIRVRLFTWNLEQPIDSDLISQRIQDAISLRLRTFNLTPSPDNTTACRLINSEGDNLPGLTVDFYAGWLCVQMTSLALYQRLETIQLTLERICSPLGIWLKVDSAMNAAEGIESEDRLLSGQLPQERLIVSENDVCYEVDFVSGQKTGFYCDQRENRLAVSRYITGGDVLDAFCYSGGFGLHALRHSPAAQVLSIDSSEPAIELTQRNAQLNGFSTQQLTAQRGKVLDVLVALHAANRQFSTVILDPPKMVQSRGGLERGLKGYLKLNLAGIQLIPSGGILATCSCSGHVSMTTFHEMLASAAMQSNRIVQILESRGHAHDHPVSANCPESQYLKCVICRVI